MMDFIDLRLFLLSWGTYVCWLLVGVCQWTLFITRSWIQGILCPEWMFEWIMWKKWLSKEQDLWMCWPLFPSLSIHLTFATWGTFHCKEKRYDRGEKLYVDYLSVMSIYLLFILQHTTALSVFVKVLLEHNCTDLLCTIGGSLN